MARKDRTKIAKLADDALDREERTRLTGELVERRSPTLIGALAAIELAPGVGGALGQLMADLLERKREERLDQWAHSVSRAIARLEDRVDGDYVRSDEFESLFEEVFEQVQRRQADGKRAYYAAALANSLSRQRLEPAEQARMLAALNELRPSHLELLAVVASTTKHPPGAEGSSSIKQVLQVLIPERGSDPVRMDWDDLDRLKILGGYPVGIMTPSGTADLTTRLTDFGRRFVAWISLLDEGPASDDKPPVSAST